ncbi:MAG: hypothetical protein HYU77_02190 [Betaproteobacteria bacterium]|nr:hypothetical protein [Betaproteobacteria bacterium]
MLKRTIIAVLIGTTLGLGGGHLLAAGQQPAQQKEQVENKAEHIYGYQLMTPQERAEYRDRMRAAKTWEAREAIRAEHHKAMVERAKEKGLTLPDEAPAWGQRFGPGSRFGPRHGMGPGSGFGPRHGMGPDGGFKPCPGWAPASFTPGK